MNYEEFLKSKLLIDPPTGFDVKSLPDFLFNFQSDCVRWALRRGRSALFEDCGLGKSPQQLVWAQKVAEKTKKPVLILAPYCVAQQTAKIESIKFGMEVNLVHNQSEIKSGINITNYEKLHRLDASVFGGVVLDESSILKAYDGKTRDLIIQSFPATPYKLACTATPSPNDFMELGNHAEFLGIMSRTEMLATFFVHDGGDTSKWRLKRHAEKDFWKWICSWAINIRRPSDLGYSDKDFTLPKLNMVEHVVQSEARMDGYLIPMPASTLKERRDARRESMDERIAKACEIANNEQWIYWCNLNAESEAIAKKLDAVDVRGSTSEEERERIAINFIRGKIKRVVTKPDLWGFGLNLQCCHNTAIVGLSDSYEQFYQLIRRFWRFGQKQQVNVHIIISSLEGAVLKNIHRKEADAKKMSDEMIKNMREINRVEIKGQSRESEIYNANQFVELPKFI